MDIKLLENSFEQVAPQAIAFSASFYETLFKHHPQLKPMFAEVSQEAQEKKLVFSLAAIVENLRNPEVLQPALKSLGARHFQVGTLKKHYPMVGQALIETFATYLGDDWTPETEKVWLDAYNVIAETMLAGTVNPAAHLEPELTFYDWVDLFGDEDPQVKAMIQSVTDFHYRDRQVS